MAVQRWKDWTGRSERAHNEFRVSRNATARSRKRQLEMNINQANQERLVLAYTRCSTERQVKDGYGKPVQIRAIQAWAEMSNRKVDRWFHDSESGKTDERAEFQQMRTLVREGKVEKVVIARQDRLARSSLVAEAFYQELRSFGGELVNVQIAIDDSPLGKVIRKLLDSFAELDRDLIVERTSRGAREKVRTTGLHQGGAVATGYKAASAEERDKLGLPKGSLVFDETAAEAVRIMFTLREKGHSYGGIAGWLNQRGYVGRHGCKFSAGTVMSIIANEAFYRCERVSMSREVLGLSEEDYLKLVPKHPPLLSPRQAGQPDLLERVKRTPMREAAIPDDPFIEHCLVPERHPTITFVTREYGQALEMMQSLLDEGRGYTRVANDLNDAGHRTRTGCLFNGAGIYRVEKMLHRLLPLAKEALLRPIPELGDALDRRLDSATERILELARTRDASGGRLLSYAQVAERLNETHRTPRGGQFHAMTIKRVLDASPQHMAPRRNVAYVRLTKDGEDHTGQFDQIETWAEENGVIVDEWFIDRGPAHKSNELPELKRLLVEADASRVNSIAVTNRDVLCRDPDDAKMIVRKLQVGSDLHYAGRNHKLVPKKVPYVPTAKHNRQQNNRTDLSGSVGDIDDKIL
jgi:DNA invertase Pin-like site-specific DNA recombinase